MSNTIKTSGGGLALQVTLPAWDAALVANAGPPGARDQVDSQVSATPARGSKCAHISASK